MVKELIENSKVNWNVFLELQSKHNVGEPSQVAYQNAVDELVKDGKLSENGNYMLIANGPSILRSPTGPCFYFTERSDAETYSSLRWPGLKSNVHPIAARN
jgi:hypothetical protein